MPLPGAAVVALCAGAFLAALGLTAVARRYALHRHLLDAPGERRSHLVATPRGGGIAIVAVMLAALVGLGSFAGDARPVFLLGACGLGMVAAIGWIDDHRPLSPWTRLAVHVVAAVLLASALVWSGQPMWWALAVGVLALGLINVWNFMDGIDGIASTQALLIALGLALLSLRGAGALAACLLAAACAGFLPFNFPKARIFLGDVGSGGLGYLVACLLALAPHVDPSAALALLIPLSAFMIDATLTLLSRIIRGERWWSPHVQHVYQRCVQAGHPHAVVTSGYAAWTLLSILVSSLVSGSPPPVIMGAFATWYVLGIAIWLMFRVRHVRRAGLS